MEMKYYTFGEFESAVMKLRSSHKVFAPVQDGRHHVFRELADGDRPDFSCSRPRVSPKGLIFPQSERLLVYTTDESDPGHHIMEEAQKEFPPQVVVGIHPCDAAAFKLLDVNFDTPEYKDPWWIRRYAATTLVGICRPDADATMFSTMSCSGPMDERGLDAALYDLGDGYAAKALTEKGRAVIGELGGGEATTEQREAVDRLIASAPGAQARATAPGAQALAAAPGAPALDDGRPEPPRLPSLASDRLKSQPLVPLFEADFWDEVAAGCLNCGICTFLCPTCWCFDIQDEVHKRQGDRIRNWDSCMFPLYTLHASGHNPRGMKTQRVRNRFMHKLKYYVDKYSLGVMCVGCGRCVEACPVNIDIREVAERMNSFAAPEDSSTPSNR